MNNKSLIKKLVEAFDFEKLKPKNLTVQQSTMQQSLLRMNEYNLALSKTVDLGLPSGTLWCKFNVGAKNESDPGDYFAWGETEPKDEYTIETYKYANGAKNCFTKYTSHTFYADNDIIDNKIILDDEDDAATVNMGKYWCIPTEEQCQELLDNTKLLYQEEVGLIFISKINNAKLIIPGGGWFGIDKTESNDEDDEDDNEYIHHRLHLPKLSYIWTKNTPGRFLTGEANNLENMMTMCQVSIHNREQGLNIRPVFRQ